MDAGGVGELSAEVTRVADRLRTLGAARLALPLDQGTPAGSVADVAYGVAQKLADLAADVEGRSRRPVPRIGDHAVGDQVAVTGHDLAAVGDRLTSSQVAAAVGWLRELRRALP